jgi:hypothetical protein
MLTSHFFATSRPRTVVFGLLLAAGTGLLTGCGTPTKMGKLYEGPNLPASAVATVVRMDSWARDGNLVSYDWIAYVNAVDGQKIGAFTRVQVAPGRHKLSLSCELNPKHKGYSCKPTEFEITAEAGKTYVSVRPSHLDGRRGAQEERQEEADQRCGSNSSIRLAGCVGSRSSTSRMYA